MNGRTPTPPPATDPKPGTRAVPDRLDAGPGVFHDRHADPGDALHGPAVPVDTVATDVDRDTARPTATAPKPTAAAPGPRRRRGTGPGPCPCACNHGGFCGGCGHAGCGGR
ncbi:hypothetical protein [Embleya sp. NPDC059237]|uniref:hypothetical protein n=1 Tax=Embleya sp. NPDC059237 TaxID=3346784 RepID=UPI0036990ED7